MGSHLIEGEFQSDKYPTTPRGKVPLSVKDKTAQDLLWEYAQRRRSVDAEFSDDLETALLNAGHNPAPAGWVWVVPNDQTIGYLTANGSVTVLPSEAHLFESEQQARSATDEWNEPIGEAEAISDVVAFRARAPEWGDRPLSMQTLFGMAERLMAGLHNDNLRAERFEVRSEAYLLSSAAHVFLKALGHQDEHRQWVFGNAVKE